MVPATKGTSETRALPRLDRDLTVAVVSPAAERRRAVASRSSPVSVSREVHAPEPRLPEQLRWRWQHPWRQSATVVTNPAAVAGMMTEFDEAPARRSPRGTVTAAWRAPSAEKFQNFEGLWSDTRSLLAVAGKGENVFAPLRSAWRRAPPSSHGRSCGRSAPTRQFRCPPAERSRARGQRRRAIGRAPIGHEHSCPGSSRARRWPQGIPERSERERVELRLREATRRCSPIIERSISRTRRITMNENKNPISTLLLEAILHSRSHKQIRGR